MPANIALRSLVFLLTAVMFATVADAQDVQIQSIDGRLVTGVGEVDESLGPNSTEADTLSISIGQRVFSRILQPNFIGINPGFNVEPTGNPLLPTGVEGIGDGTSVFLDFAPTTLDGITSSVFFWDGADSNSDGELTFDDINLTLLDNTRSFAVQDSEGDAFFFDEDIPEIQPAGFINTTTETEGLGADVELGGRLHQHLNLVSFVNGVGITPNQEAGLFVASFQVRAEGFESSDPFFFVLHPTLPPEEEGELPIVQFGEEAALLTAFIEESLVALPGDFNLDGVVDAADFVVARDGGTEFDVDEAFGLFSENFDPSVPVAAAAAPLFASATVVPEPATIGLVLLAMTGTVVRRRR